MLQKYVTQKSTAKFYFKKTNRISCTWKKKKKEKKNRTIAFLIAFLFSTIERKFVFDLSQIAIKFYVMNFFFLNLPDNFDVSKI
jgi:hypothetical protein